LQPIIKKEDLSYIDKRSLLSDVVSIDDLDVGQGNLEGDSILDDFDVCQGSLGGKSSCSSSFEDMNELMLLQDDYDANSILTSKQNQQFCVLNGFHPASI